MWEILLSNSYYLSMCCFLNQQVTLELELKCSTYYFAASSVLPNKMTESLKLGQWGKMLSKNVIFEQVPSWLSRLERRFRACSVRDVTSASPGLLLTLTSTSNCASLLSVQSISLPRGPLAHGEDYNTEIIDWP